MAPIDRREHRQHRVRGAGPSAVQASFGFSFNTLGAAAVKQALLSPIPSSRRTPTYNPSRTLSGTGQRHQSASIQSGSGSTPKNRIPSPQLGKRKRGSSGAQPALDDCGEDELSPQHGDGIHSDEANKRVHEIVPSTQQNLDQVAEELPAREGGENFSGQAFLNNSTTSNSTTILELSRARISSDDALRNTPTAVEAGTVSVTSQQSVPERSQSAEHVSLTPRSPSDIRTSRSATRLDTQLNTSDRVLVGEESEDELSSPPVNGTTLSFAEKQQPSAHNVDVDDAFADEDELSSLIQASSIPKKSRTQRLAQNTTRKTAKHNRSRSNAVDQKHTVIPEVPSQLIQHRKLSKPRKINEIVANATPARRRLKTRGSGPSVVDGGSGEEMDELSPDFDRTAHYMVVEDRQKGETEEAANTSIHDEHEETLIDGDSVPKSSPVARVQQQQRSPRQNIPIRKPRQKRQMSARLTQSIPVMRIKGSMARGITVADTTRAILGETIDDRLNRLSERMHASSNASVRKDLRREIRLFLSFKESLDEKLLDLQDANDVLSINSRKLKILKRDVVGLRQEILALQDKRQDIALEHDDVQAVFEAEKARNDAKKRLNANMFDIEAAIQNGRDKARRERREDEGPRMPLSMVLDQSVGGSLGNGLLERVIGMNGVMERTVDWLEGRA